MAHINGLISLLLILQIFNQSLAYFSCSQTKCDCSESADRGFDIDCPDSFNSQVKISFDLDGEKERDLEIDCKYNQNYVNYLPTQYLPPEVKDLKLDYLGFKTCSLPGNITVRAVMQELRIETTKILRISFSNLENITRKDLDGLQEVENLEVIGNKITNTPNDLIYDLKKLKTLDMKSNNIIIPQEFFHGTPQLKAIEIAENFLPSNTINMFKNLNELIHLNMWMMSITEIEPTLFSDLTNLETLELSLNKIHTLPPKIFGDLKKLKTLSLRRNSLETLPERLFENNTHLEILYLNENVNLTTLPQFLFANMTYLKNVTIADCSLNVIPGNLFLGSKNIIFLDLSKNYIENLPDELLRDQSSLKVLNLEDNGLKQISEEFFANFKELTVLNLNYNYFKMVPYNFGKLNTLKVLGLSNNQLEVVYQETFRGLTALTDLDLSYNNLTLMEQSTRDIYGYWTVTKDLSKLERLYLQHNNISLIFNDWKYSKFQLKTLDLSYNIITNLSYSDFEFLQKNIEVNLENNQISDIDMSGAERTIISKKNYTSLQPFIGYRKEKLVTIKLDNNPLHCSCNLYDLYRYFDLTMNPEVRTVLDIQSDHLLCASPEEMANKRVDNIKSNNFICKISSELMNTGFCPNLATCLWKPYDNTLTINLEFVNLKEFPDLSILNSSKLIFQKYVVLMQGNGLKKMPERGKGFENVHILDLSYNDISKVEWVPDNLQVLLLHNNNLTFLNDNEISFLNKTNLMTLSLYNNPWECNCSTTNFLKFIQDQFKKLPKLQNITCQETNLQIVDLTVEDLCPMPTQIIILLCVFLTFVSLSTALLAGLYYRYNIEIKVWLYAHQQCLWFVTEEELDKDKIYDAFISYSHKDEDFIVSDLINNLESGPKPYKLCLHFRNWLPGEFISKNIANSIAESRRTLVILSPNFLESEWGKMEFRTAHKQALEESRARVIVILLGDIPMENLDEEIKAYLNTNTYLKWGDPWFWDKLRYALPHTPKFFKDSPGLEKIRIDGEKMDLIHEPSTPPIGTTPPADKINFDPMFKNGVLNVSLINGSLINNGLVEGKLDQNYINT